MSYSINEVSQRFGLPPHTLRYYEKEGLLPAVKRSEKGVRIYDDEDLNWLDIICCMRATGMPIAYIKKYISLCHQGTATLPERRQMIIDQRAVIEGELLKYQGLLEMVDKKVRRYNELVNQYQTRPAAEEKQLQSIAPKTVASQG